MRSTKLGEPKVEALKEGRRELRQGRLGLRLSLEKRDLVLFKLVFSVLEGHGEDFEVPG